MSLKPIFTLTLVGLVGCGGNQAATKSIAAGPKAIPQEYPGWLRDPGLLKGDFEQQQRVTVSVPGREESSFEAVLKKEGNQLSLIGLTPFSTVIFAAQQTGLNLQFSNQTGEKLPFGARSILLDVQRAFFPWLEGPIESGRRQGMVKEEQVVEVYQDSSLVERSFLRKGTAEAKMIVVKYQRRMDGTISVVELENQLYGYSLKIEVASGGQFLGYTPGP